MKQRVLAFLILALGIGVTAIAQPPAQNPPAVDLNAHYQIGPDSLAHEGVPKGEVRGPFVLPSQAYPGTQHTYWVYVPAQYDRAVQASLMVFQDGQAFKDMDGVLRTPNVLDNLIYRREIPLMVAVFINPSSHREMKLDQASRLSLTSLATKPQMQPVGLGRPAILHACLAGP